LRRWSCLLQNNVAFAKNELRKRIRTERLTIAVSEREAAAEAAANLFVAQAMLQNYDSFAAYIAHGGEFDVMPLLRQIWQAKKTCYLPVLSVETPGQLQFVKYQEDTPLQTNRYHILEPDFSLVNEIPVTNLDVVLLPLTAFNREGFRLGSGGGYYDKTFAFLREEKPARPLMIGVGFASQEVAELPYDDWDVKLDGILTEQEFLIF
jgi:5-formyltetrahydrofolate cyclo-ligase